MNNEMIQSNPEHKLMIFRTKTDRESMDISTMSDFMANNIVCLMNELIISPDDRNIPIPIEDAAIVKQLMNGHGTVVKDGVEYLLDFDSLPKDILEKYRKGLLKFGESRQVDGNLRAVLVDASGTRVKDITLKKAEKVAENADQLQNIAIQYQLKQINEKLDTITQMQEYHIEFDRNNELVKPFFDARDSVVHAQNEHNSQRQLNYLDNAVRSLESAMNAIYLDITTHQKYIGVLTKLPVFRPTKVIDKFIGYIAQDLQLLAKYNGVLLQLLTFMGKTEDKIYAYSKFKTYMTDFCTKAVGSKQLPLAIQLHNAYSSYTQVSMDAWKKLSDEMVPLLQKDSVIDEAYIIEIGDTVYE